MTTTRYHAECSAAARAIQASASGSSYSGVCRTCWNRGETEAGQLGGPEVLAAIAAEGPRCVQCGQAEHDATAEAGHRFTPPLAAGDGATLRRGTDGHACTVIAASASGRTITLQRDKATRDPAWKPDTHPGGFLGHTVNNSEQRWTYEPDPDGVTFKARVTRRGWSANGTPVVPGRHEFYDYNF